MYNNGEMKGNLFVIVRSWTDSSALRRSYDESFDTASQPVASLVHIYIEAKLSRLLFGGQAFF